MTLHEITVSTAEIRSAWSEIQAGRNPLGERQAGSGVTGHIRAGHYSGEGVSSFIGCSGAQMQGWLQDGYYPDAPERQMPGGVVEITTPFVDLVEEDGDLILSQALGGEDLCFARWEEFEAQRGLTIRACIGMHAGVSARVLGAYMKWILTVIDAAERRGVAPDVELYITTKGSFRGDHALVVRIPLVKAGEIVDAVAWRAFLTPGAFRSLGFLALGLAADKVGRSLVSGMGFPTNREWSVELDGDVLTIECPGGAGEFPADLMDAKLETAYAGA